MTYNTKVSKKLSWILRHGANEVNVKLDKNGWAELEEILALHQFKQVTYERVLKIVEDCPKQRFSLEERNGRTYIKANQGHSIKSLDLKLEPVDPVKQPFAYHGTYTKVWPKIQEQGLSRMKRIHIHFAANYPKSSEDSSGIRSSCQLIIEVDVAKLLKDGFSVCRSPNNVILSEGNEKGFIPPSYFVRVVDRKTGKNIFPAADEDIKKNASITH